MYVIEEVILGEGGVWDTMPNPLQDSDIAALCSDFTSYKSLETQAPSGCLTFDQALNVGMQMVQPIMSELNSHQREKVIEAFRVWFDENYEHTNDLNTVNYLLSLAIK